MPKVDDSHSEFPKKLIHSAQCIAFRLVNVIGFKYPVSL